MTAPGTGQGQEVHAAGSQLQGPPAAATVRAVTGQLCLASSEPGPWRSRWCAQLVLPSSTPLPPLSVSRGAPGFLGSLSRALPPFSFLTSFSLLRLMEARSLLKEPLRLSDPVPS